jgi:hypothetical protein
MFLMTGWEGHSNVLISVESVPNKYYFSRFMDFRESLTLATLQSGLNTLHWQTRPVQQKSHDGRVPLRLLLLWLRCSQRESIHNDQIP